MQSPESSPQQVYQQLSKAFQRTSLLHAAPVVYLSVLITGFTRDDAGHWNARMPDGGEQRIGRSYADNVRRLTGRA